MSRTAGSAAPAARLVFGGAALAAALALGWSLYMLIAGGLDRRESRLVYAEIRERYREAEREEASLAGGEAQTAAGRAADEARPLAGPPPASRVQAALPEAFRELLAQNEDAVGWIRIDDTPIDYPVVQGEDNEFYLKHGFDRQQRASGAVFMDYRNDPDEAAGRRNLVLYGHRMKNGTMFKGLTRFMDRGFRDRHRVIRFDMYGEEIEWEVFSVYTTDTAFDYIRTSFDDDRGFLEFAAAISEKSVYRTDAAIGPQDELLTLSTCDYSNPNGRLVVHAVRRR
ncbi:class B sortase [Cohnella fermenti]|uniref:Class B sortase n=1 Tax=Cohnella fermenti TaxID=2565925 RepID=A0A4S4C828_9BACL|nr:class B sortase [Cohnella fermenti]THF84094.1 class B sortase [Cohnella fermenti]